jgi:hypothetical protein
MKRMIVLAALVALIAPASSAASASGLHVIGSGSAPARGSARSHVSAHASQTDAHLLYLRVYGRHLTYRWKLHCVSDRYGAGQITTYTPESRTTQSGQLHRLIAGNPYAPPSLSQGDCTITASASGRGPIRLQILAG